MATPKGTRPWNLGKGRGWVDKRGYRWIYVFENGRRVARREHRVILEKRIGRKLEPWELVHHKDGDTKNNSAKNLEIFEWGTHTTLHHTGSRRDQDARRSMEAFALLREELKRERELKKELLQALELAIPMLERGIQTEAIRSFQEKFAIALAVSKNVIAKAKGEQE